MKFLPNAIASGIAGKLGELKTPKETGSPDFNKRQAIREYNALLGMTGPREPAGNPVMECLSSDKGIRRDKQADQHELSRYIPM